MATPEEELQEAWLARYREGVAPWQGGIPHAIRVMLEHRSVRSFADRPVPQHLTELLVAAGQSAPTSSNKQLWSVVAVQDAARRRRLAELCGKQAMVSEAPLLLVWLADHSRIDAVARRAGVDLEGLDYLESFLVAAVDATLAAQNAVVAAESLGLGTVYIGAMRNHPEHVASELRLPRKCFALFGLCVGYPSPNLGTAIKPRLPQAAVLHHETYSTQPISEAVDRHDSHYAAFRAEQNMSPTTWSEHIMSRLNSKAALSGRHRLTEALQALGFPLR